MAIFHISCLEYALKRWKDRKNGIFQIDKIDCNEGCIFLRITPIPGVMIFEDLGENENWDI